MTSGEFYLINCKLCDTPTVYRNRNELEKRFPGHIHKCTVELFFAVNSRHEYWIYEYSGGGYLLSDIYSIKNLFCFTIAKILSPADSVDFNYLWYIYDLNQALPLHSQCGKNQKYASALDIIWKASPDSKFITGKYDEINEYLLKFCAVVQCIFCEMEYSSPPDNKIIFAHLANCKGVCKKN